MHAFEWVRTTAPVSIYPKLVEATQGGLLRNIWQLMRGAQDFAEQSMPLERTPTIISKHIVKAFDAKAKDCAGLSEKRWNTYFIFTSTSQ